jgi:hypothetical protein
MIFPSLLALGAQLLVHVSADIPRLNVQQVCEGIAIQGGSSFHDQSVAKDTQDCLQSENEVRQELARRWSTFTASDKTHCINESEMGGDSSYTELLTCLEMAHDVHNLGDEQTSSKPAHPLAAHGPLRP